MEDSQKPRKYTVKTMRPTFQFAVVEVAAEDFDEARERAMALAPNLPENAWLGSFLPKDYSIDVVKTSEGLYPQVAYEGNPFGIPDDEVRYALLAAFVDETGTPATDAAFVSEQPWLKGVLRLSSHRLLPKLDRPVVAAFDESPRTTGGSAE